MTRISFIMVLFVTTLFIGPLIKFKKFINSTDSLVSVFYFLKASLLLSVKKLVLRKLFSLYLVLCVSIPAPSLVFDFKSVSLYNDFQPKNLESRFDFSAQLSVWICL